MIASLVSREGAHTGRGRRSASSFGAKFKQGKADVLLLALKITLLLKSFSNGNGDEIFSYKTIRVFSNFVAIIQARIKCQTDENFSGLVFWGPHPSLLEI